jgi:two-component system nitrate/nitrite response regulator NarL
VGVGVHRIVLAEDDEEYLVTLEALLVADGRFEVVGRAHNGREAVELAHELEPDAVVMDIEMPELDGVEATRQLQNGGARVPVLAISGHDYEERVLDIRHAGAADYVRKARVADELCDALAALLRP